MQEVITNETIFKSYQMFFDNQAGDFIAVKVLFQMVKIYFITLSIVSMCSILYFIIYCRDCLKFNWNMKILFYFQFSSCFAHSVILGIFQIHHLAVIFLAKQPSDLTLSPLFYICCHIPFMLSLFITCSSQIVLIGEQTLASYFFTFYENKINQIGIISAILTISAPVIVTIFIFYNVDFDFPTITVLSTPPTAMLKINILLLTFITFYIITVFHSVKLYRFNKIKNGSCRSQTSLGLSSKYQMSENVISSRLLWQMTFAQTLIYLIYMLLLFNIRILVPRPKPPIWIVLTEMCYTPPIYCALLPILCIVTIRKAQKERNQSILSIVSLQVTGTEGWNNYQKMLEDQWASKAPLVRCETLKKSQYMKT